VARDRTASRTSASVSTSWSTLTPTPGSRRSAICTPPITPDGCPTTPKLATEPLFVVCPLPVTVDLSGASSEIVRKWLATVTFGAMVLGCARGTAPAGRGDLPVGFGDQGGVSVQDDGDVIRIGVRPRTAEARCPGCGGWWGRVHGSYLRFPADLPVAGRRVVLRLRAGRFTCDDASCERRTFVEQVTGLTRRHSQRTGRMRSALAEVGLAAPGRAGARLADVFGARVSRNTAFATG
jgi:hypothetical protein